MKFIYEEPITSTLPIRIKIHEDPSSNNYEAILIRLLSGTINLYNEDLNHKIIKQRINYFLFTSEKNNRACTKVLRDINPGFINNDIINPYLIYSRNKDFFKELVNELSCFLYFKNINSHTTAFIHIYRFIEHMSITFPLFYASISNDYNNSFGQLKTFFNSNNNGGPLSFNKVFFKSLFTISDTTIPYNNNIELDFSFLNNDEFNNIKRAFISVIDSEKSLKKDDFTFDDKKIIFKFSYIHDLIITFRNRFFHYMPTHSHNISSTYFVSEIFFKIFNEYAVNWIGYLFGEMLEKRISTSI